MWQSCLGIDGWEALYSTLPHPHDDDGVAWAYPGTTGESYMNTACLNAGLTQPLLLFASHLTTFTIEAERILSLDATISERRARLILFFPLEGAATFSRHSQRNHLQFIYTVTQQVVGRAFVCLLFELASQPSQPALLPTAKAGYRKARYSWIIFRKISPYNLPGRPIYLRNK